MVFDVCVERDVTERAKLRRTRERDETNFHHLTGHYRISFVDVAAVALAAVAMIGVARPVGAQPQLTPDPPYDARLRAGPLTVAPVIRIWNAGHDSNVFNRDSGSDPKGNTTFTASPSVALWLR